MLDWKYMEIPGKVYRNAEAARYNLLCADCPVRRIPGHAGRAFHRAQHPENVVGAFLAEPAGALRGIKFLTLYL